MDTSQILGFVLAASLGIDAPVSTRMYKTGELTEANKSSPLLILLYVSTHGLVFLSAIFYFSWAYLGWQHIAAFFVFYFAVGEWLASVKNKAAAWTTLVTCNCLALFAEVMLLMPEWFEQNLGTILINGG